LPQPRPQQGLDVQALPGAGAGLGLDLQGADSDPGAVALLPGFEAGDLQEDGGDGVGRAQVDPQLGVQDVFGLDLGTEAEEAAGGQLGPADRMSCRKTSQSSNVFFRIKAQQSTVKVMTLWI